MSEISEKELTITTSKEIFLKLLGSPEIYSADGTTLKGSNLAAHIGDCFKTLTEKVAAAIKNP